jgi:hypothetical protein
MSEPENFFRSENVWILIPLAALSIPVLAIMRDTSWIGWVFGSVVLVIALTVAARSLLNHRHSLKMKEIEAQERVMLAEQEHLASAQRILELDDVQERLRRQEPPTPA